MPAAEVSLDLELFRGYELEPGSYDEVFASRGELRPAWRRFSKPPAGLAAAEYVRRWEQAQRLLRQNSLAYPDLRDPAARRRPWELDGLPLIIAGRRMADGRSVAEAARDVARPGAARPVRPAALVRDGILPPEVLFRHPGFRLPFCRGPAERAEYARCCSSTRPTWPAAPDGRWWVLADRCGKRQRRRLRAGESHRDIADVARRVRGNAASNGSPPYFIAVKEQLARLAPQHDDEPRIVLLSQAAGSINYFEDAFLARYLGYTLAEAGDLAVRRNRLFLKTLAGLSPVNVLMRRPNSEHSTRSKLPTTDSRGVAGLLPVGAQRQRRDRQFARQRTGRVARVLGVPAHALPKRCSASRCRCRALPRGGAANRTVLRLRARAARRAAIVARLSPTR